VSIQPGRVLWRIANEVRRTPELRLPAESQAWTTCVTATERVDLVRVGVAETHGFASLLHFWAHALRTVLAGQGQGNQLEGVVGYAMCESIDRRGLDAAWQGRTAGMQVQGLPASVPSDALREAYRMVDGECRASCVAASETEWLAFFWAHGAAMHLVGAQSLQLAARPSSS